MSEKEQRFDPDATWGKNGWLRHYGCPVAVLAGQPWAQHSKAFHGRPLRAADESGSTGGAS